MREQHVTAVELQVCTNGSM